MFGDYSSEALLGSLREALHVWPDRKAWTRLMQNGMARDFSWNRQGRHYLELYQRLIGGA